MSLTGLTGIVLDCLSPDGYNIDSLLPWQALTGLSRKYLFLHHLLCTVYATRLLITLYSNRMDEVNTAHGVLIRPALTTHSYLKTRRQTWKA